MKAILVDNSGDKPVMVPGEYPDPVPNEQELLVKIEATALNRADLLQKSGKYPPPEGASPVLGLEMAGIVEKTGPGVKNYKAGDLVFGLLPGGGYAEFCTIHQGLAMPIPDILSFEEAAALPEVFLTAYQALTYLGNVNFGETILIHAGGSGVGTAAIQLAKRLFGCRVITTAGKKHKLNKCLELGAELAINYKKKSFDELIENRYGKNAVDLVIDFIGAPYWEKNIRCLGMDGRLVYLSMLGGIKVKEMNLIPILRKRLTLKGSTLRNRTLDYKIQLTRDFQSQVSDYINNESIIPVIDSIFDWEDAEEAHQRMEKNQNTGKIVLNGM